MDASLADGRVVAPLKMLSVSPMARSDKGLLAAFLLAAVLGTWTRSLLLNDGAVMMSVGWLGDAWHLFFDQITGRAVAVLTLFGPAWAARAAFGLDASTYMTMAHVLYFAVPFVMWLALRAIERDRLFSRLYWKAKLQPSNRVNPAGVVCSWPTRPKGPPVFWCGHCITRRMANAAGGCCRPTSTTSRRRLSRWLSTEAGCWTVAIASA